MQGPVHSARYWLLVGALAAGAVILLTLLFVAYQQPGLLIDFASLRYCG